MAASSPSTVSHGFGVFSSRRGNSGFRGRVFGCHDSSHGRHKFSCGGRPYGYGRGSGSRLCMNYGGTSHTVEYCYYLHGFAQVHRVTASKDVG